MSQNFWQGHIGYSVQYITVIIEFDYNSFAVLINVQ